MTYSIEKTLDSLGRIVLPKSMRDYYGISVNDKLYLIPTEQGILIAKESREIKYGGRSEQSEETPAFFF